MNDILTEPAPDDNLNLIGSDNPAPNDPPSDPPAPAPAPDWRKEYAGDDEKMFKRLSRYSTQNDVIKAGLEAQDTLRTTRSNTLPDNPTDEQMTEYRANNGIPPTAGEYDLTLSDGLVIGDDDKPMVDAYLEAMHGANSSTSQIQAGLSAFFAVREAEIAQVAEKDETDKQSALSAVKDEWGPDFHANKNALQSFLNQIPEDSRDAFANARMGDGTALLNDPGMLMFLSDLSRKTNPDAHVMPSSDNPAGDMVNEIKTLKGWMDANDPRYWGDKEAQSRYLTLLEAEMA